MTGTSQFRTIVVDPPWRYQQKLDRPTVRGGLKYATMAVDDIAALPVSTWAAQDCQLWLWTTNSHLHDAFHVLEAWGFRYVTMLTWVKTRMGLGYWLRGKTEHCLLGVKGSPRSRFIGPHGSSGYDYSTLISAVPRGHSQKPQDFYDMLLVLSEEPRLELFATKHRLGFVGWGAELGVMLSKDGEQEVQG